MMYNRRSFLKASALCVGAASLARPGSAAAAPRAVFTPLRRNVGIFTERGGTVGWLINSDGVAVIDSQFADTAPMIVSGIGERTRLPIDVLINTHQHPDHTGGNAVMRPSVGKIVAHERAIANLRAAAQRAGSAADTSGLPDTAFGTSWSVSIGDETIRLRHYGPAHTGGDAAIFFERANVVHLGDLLNNRGWPNIDAPSGGSVHGWVNVLEAVMQDYPADALYVFGHNEAGYPPTGTRTDLAFQRDYFLAVIEVAGSAIREGRTREQAIDLQTLPGFEHFGGQVARLPLAVGVAFDELQAGRE
jgi:glyoxylase-like metal-dependent hydrolase (beta-lactamase superfamily II)